MRAYKTYCLVGILLLVAASGCSKSTNNHSDQSEPSSATTIATINKICPIEGGEVDPKLTTEWNGQTVGFCCAPCLPAWNELSEEDKRAKVATTDSKKSSGHAQQQESSDAT